MTKQCVICGAVFEAKRKDSVTCSDPDCRKAHYKELTALWKEQNYDHVKELNKEWIKARRKKQKAERIEKQKQINNFEAIGYAERQIAKTLALAGKVQI